ncbi:Uncharacterised protein [Klebsiella pneumoniae]|nr:Uncharacterised protein [Klebsiella pneumoniae]
MIDLQAGFCRLQRAFPAAAENRPLFEGEAGLRVRFNHLLHHRRQTAAVDALVVEEFDHCDFAVGRAVGRGIFILGQHGGVLQHRLSGRAGLLLSLNLLQFLARLQQDFRVGNQIVGGDFADFRLLFRGESRRRVSGRGHRRQ